MEKAKNQLVTHFIKSPDFKTTYVSGVFGGVTSHGLISMSYFLERTILPVSIEYEIDQSTGLASEIGRDAKTGVVREVHGGLLLEVEHAKSIVLWLNEKIAQVEAKQKKQ